MNFYDVETDELIQQFFPEATKVENQRKGCAVDYQLPSGEYIEVKLDYSSSRTGNLFIEYEYTNKTTVMSGLAITAEIGAIALLAVMSGKTLDKLIKVPAKDLLSLCKTAKLRTVATRNKVNGNKDGVFSRGYLLPISKIPENWVIFTKGPHEE